MIRVKQTFSNEEEYTLEINGHANYGDAKAGDELTYKKVCACVTLIVLTIHSYSRSCDVNDEITKGHYKVVAYKDTLINSIRPLIVELNILAKLQPNYIMVESLKR